MMKNKTYYNELASAEITDSRNIVISECSKGGFTIAQQLKVEGTRVFMKGAFHVNDLEGLYNLRNAINLVISQTEKDFESDDDDWVDDDDIK